MTKPIGTGEYVTTRSQVAEAAKKFKLWIDEGGMQLEDTGEIIKDNPSVGVHQRGQEELYQWAKETAEEWYKLKVVDAHQMVALQMLLHEMDKRASYEYMGGLM